MSSTITLAAYSVRAVFECEEAGGKMEGLTALVFKLRCSRCAGCMISDVPILGPHLCQECRQPHPWRKVAS